MIIPVGTRPEISDGLTAYPTPDEQRRLAERAQERGIRIEWSTDRPRAIEPWSGRSFDLTAVSCTCRLFVVSGACQHHALLTAQINQWALVAGVS